MNYQFVKSEVVFDVVHNIMHVIVQGVKLRLIQAPMRLNFSFWRPNPES